MFFCDCAHAECDHIHYADLTWADTYVEYSSCEVPGCTCEEFTTES